MRLSSYLKITPMMLNNDILLKLIDKLTGYTQGDFDG
jgi:hypothetical protein